MDGVVKMTGMVVTEQLLQVHYLITVIQDVVLNHANQDAAITHANQDAVATDAIKSIQDVVVKTTGTINQLMAADTTHTIPVSESKEMKR